MKALRKMKKGCIGYLFAIAFMAVGAAVICGAFSAEEVFAETTLDAAPYARISYDEDALVKCGVIRYISQVSADEEYFHSSFWGAWESAAKHECGTSCISMALSYLGIDVTPEEILDTGGGATMFGYAWGGAAYSTPEDIGTAYARYVGGEGKYSPVIIRLRKYSSSGSHFVLIVGKKDDGSYIIVNPWSQNDRILDASISGNDVTYKGVTETITDIRQYYYSEAVLDIPKTKISQIAADVGASVSLKWKKKKVGSGYEIAYASDDFTDAQSVIVQGVSNKKITVNNLLKGKDYYFKIRVYKTLSNGDILYSKWSARKNVYIY